MRFSSFLKKKKFKPLKQCLFKKSDSDLILGIYVDDGILVGSNPMELEQIIKELSSEFKMTAVRNPETLIGLEIIKVNKEIRLTQEEYINKLLEQYGMKNSKVKVPLLKGEENKTPPKSKKFTYREIVGSLLYISSKTRPDISYATNYSSRYIENYSQENINDVKHILKYLKDNVKQGLKYSNSQPDDLLEAYCDADFAGDTETRRKHYGICRILCWRSNNVVFKKTNDYSTFQY